MSTAADLYELALTSVGDNIDTDVQVDGELPAGLSGVLLRNGPGKLESGSDPINFFDGHGFVCALTVDGAAKKAHLRGRFVETPVFLAEKAANAVTRRRVFTNHPSRWKNLASVDTAAGNGCHHEVVRWGGRVLATNDPYAMNLDVDTLATKGKETLGGLIRQGRQFCPMPRVDPATKRLIGYTLAQKPGKPDILTFVELDAQMQVVAKSADVTLSTGPAVVHQSAFTPSWHILPELPARLSAPSALWGKETIWGSLKFPAGEGVSLLLVDRKGSDRTVRVQIPQPVVFHLANAFEDNGKVIVDLVAYDDEVPFELIAPPALRARAPRAARNNPQARGPRLHRVVIDPSTDGGRGKLVEMTAIVDGIVDIPDVDRRFLGQRHRHLWLGAPVHNENAPVPGFYGWFHGLTRVDADTRTATTWSAGAEALCSPPAFAPRAGGTDEGDGFLLSWVMRKDGLVDVVVLDAKDIARGPVCTLKLGVHLPAISHTSFWPG